MSRKKREQAGTRLVRDPATSARLARIRQHGTAPELAVARLVRSLGHSFGVRNRDLPGSPDLANRRRLWAIYVHGCFWHSHHGCFRATVPKRNRGFWIAKFEANRVRDRRVLVRIRAKGFSATVIWECQTREHDVLHRRVAFALRHVRAKRYV